MRNLLPAVLVALLLTACYSIGPPRTCNEIAASGLRELVQRPKLAGNVQAQLATLYGLQPNQVATYPDDIHGGFTWTKNQVLGNLVTERSTPVSGVLNYQENPPGLGDVLHCLGTPDVYWAYYRFPPQPSYHLFELELYFAKLGIMAQVQEFRSEREAPRVNTSTPVSYFVYIPVGETQETLDRLEGFSARSGQQAFKVWPGRLEDIVIEVDPYLNQ